MEKLIEMIRLAHKKAIRRIETLHPQQSRGSKLYQLYSGIHDGVYKKDDEAAAALYQSDASDASYQKLKNRLNDRLMTTLLFIDGPKTAFSELDQQRLKCRRNLLVCQTLVTGYARNAALNVGRRGLLLAERYEISDLAFGFCRILISIYALKGKKKEVQEMITRQQHHQKMMLKDAKAERYYASFVVNFTHRQSKSPELKRLLETYCDELEQKLDTGTFSFFFNSYLLLAFRYELALDYENLFKFSEKALAYFMQKPKIARQAIFQFNLRKLLSAIHLLRFEEGEMAAQTAYEHTIKEGANWYGIIEPHIMLYLHAEQYQKAYQLWDQTRRLKSFNKMTEARKENWRLLEAFLHFLIAIGKIEMVDSKNITAKKFRMSRFLNEVPKFSMDKKGLNIPILILQILFAIQQKKYGEVSDRVEALNAYCYRYLRKDDTYRSNCFIKMLMVLPGAQFHRAGVIRQAKKHYQRLLKSDEVHNTKSAEIEIIPYETLWEMVLGMLDHRFH